MDLFYSTPFFSCPICHILHHKDVNHICKIPMEDTTIKPPYYCRTIKDVEIQAIDIIKAWNLSYSEGEALTHLLRAKFKGCQQEDYKKAISHLNHCLNGN